ncbi:MULTISPECIES: YihY/virulence factor BrkB family protein [Helcococcus]|uniref:YihY/virulence factor BrkB family protein n=1 Tax=Helcococcus bovis TaxID=3153252 RepID=A0ABW9F6V1_9FIRM
MKKLKNFIRYFIKLMSVSESDLASTFLAYYLLLSFIPLLAFLSQVLVYVTPNFESFIYDLMKSLPNDVNKIFMPIVKSIFNGQSSSLSLIAIGSSIWLGSRGFLGLIKSLNKIFDVNTEGKIPYYEVIFSVFYTIGFMIVIGSLLLFSVYNEKILSIFKSFTDNILIINNISNFLIDGIGYLMPMIISIVLFVFFYRYAPSFEKGKRISFKLSLIGSIIATLGIGLITFFYKFTNDTLQRSPSYYGSLGSILVTLVWLLGICQIIIYGAVFIKTYKDVIIENKTIKYLEEKVKCKRKA